MMSTKSGTPLYGDWRRRRGTKTDAHCYPPMPKPGYPLYGWLPLCKKRIDHGDTLPVEVGQPCTDCLVAAIRLAGHKATP